MSIATITAAQRVEVRDECLKAALAMQRFTQSGTTPRTDETAEVTPVLEAAAAALVVAGASGLPTTSAVVANGASVNVENSAGNLDSPATAVVTAGAVSGVRLAATKTIVDNAAAITMQNSAGTAIAGTHPATVAAGVLSNVKLAATIAPIANAAANLVVQNSAGAAITSAGLAAVAAGVLTSVRLPATIAQVTNAVKQSGWTVTGSGTFFTPTVTNGVCTGGVLSAS